MEEWSWISSPPCFLVSHSSCHMATFWGATKSDPKTTLRMLPVIKVLLLWKHCLCRGGGGFPNRSQNSIKGKRDWDVAPHPPLPPRPFFASLQSQNLSVNMEEPFSWRVVVSIVLTNINAAIKGDWKPFHIADLNKGNVTGNLVFRYSSERPETDSRNWNWIPGSSTTTGAGVWGSRSSCKRSTSWEQGGKDLENSSAADPIVIYKLQKTSFSVVKSRLALGSPVCLFVVTMPKWLLTVS